ncbi:response regulator [Streptomyces sp. NPDC059740]|uniref:response regulator transcription factor n=1 Tax=Streptomyces sp. NPDC059740 TaxID=3346926 RepID=UPI00365B2CB7
MSGAEEYTVLVVDDDFHVAGLHASYVADTPGFTPVGTARSVAEALRVAAGTRVDLALVDVYLPDGSGLDLVRGWGCDCLVLSAAAEGATVRAALAAGALGYLVKPFPTRRLTERLQGYARYRQLLDGAEAGQDTVDSALAALWAPAARQERGTVAQAATRELVLAAVREAGTALSAGEVGARTGVSRATAQRYLAGLTSEGLLRMRLRYGATGRPEQEYRPAS